MTDGTLGMSARSRADTEFESELLGKSLIAAESAVILLSPYELKREEIFQSLKRIVPSLSIPASIVTILGKVVVAAKCIVFFGFAQRRTTNAVKKEKTVLVVLTYTSLFFVDVETGKVSRAIPVLNLTSPLTVCFSSRLMHLKIRNEPDAMLTFSMNDPLEKRIRMGRTVPELVKIIRAFHTVMLRSQSDMSSVPMTTVGGWVGGWVG